MKNKEIVSLGKRRFFTINYEKKSVAYTQNYFDSYIVGLAVALNGDKFDVEFGKALAYAKADEIIRDREIQQLEESRAKLDDMDMNDIFGNRFERKCYNELKEVIKKHRCYLRNQKRLIWELSSHSPTDCPTYSTEGCEDWRSIIRKASEKSRKK